MARPLRIEYPNAAYHLAAHGNAREDVFLDDGDRRLFLDLLAEIRAQAPAPDAEVPGIRGLGLTARPPLEELRETPAGRGAWMECRLPATRLQHA